MLRRSSSFKLKSSWSHPIRVDLPDRVLPIPKLRNHGFAKYEAMVTKLVLGKYTT